MKHYKDYTSTRIFTALGIVIYCLLMSVSAEQLASCSMTDINFTLCPSQTLETQVYQLYANTVTPH